jgi:hypothetical protein
MILADEIDATENGAYGPMVNKKVKVLATRRTNGPLLFRDIELDE